MRRAHTIRYAAFGRVLLVLMLCPGLFVPVDGQRPRFYPDDPLQHEPATQDASNVQSWDVGLTPDLLLNLFGQPGDPITNQRAHNVNTADEVPDSSWFTNRIYTRTLSPGEMTRGPNTIEGPAPGRWTVIRPKSAGVSPGFTVRDKRNEVWFLTFDAREKPVAPTAAVAVASRLFWAIGYNQIESYLTTVRPEQLVLAPDVTIRAHGRRRPFTQADLDDVLARSSVSADGSYRVIAGRAVPGRFVGQFRYHGTRPDDPNDIVAHEHRRELRALQVFGAWTNLVDMKAGNTLDTVVTENGRGLVRHYLQDVGSTFGTGALAPRDGDEGHEYLYDAGPVWKRFFSFGLFTRTWQTMRYREHPEVGRFEGRNFDPETWRPRVPVAALRHARADDLFWAALRVMAFSDEQIRAAVRTGGFTDPAAENMLAEVLMERRDRIGSVYFSRVNPIVRFALTDEGVLTFENPAVRAGFAGAPEQGYEATWYRFDNATGQTEALGPATRATGERVQSPGPLPAGTAAFVKVSIHAVQPAHAAWAVPVDVYFRRSGTTWTLAGLDRLPSGGS